MLAPHKGTTMSEAQVIETNSVSHNRNLSRIERDEQELKSLMQGQGVNSDEQEEEDTPQEELNSSQLTGSQVQTEGDTEQKKEPKSEAQKDDTDLSSEEKSFKKRYSDIRRHMQDKEQEWKIKLEKLESQLNLATKNELVLPKSEKDIETWAKKYPDVAGIVEAIADKKAQERSADLDGRLKEIEELRVTAKREKAEAELYALHPDFNNIRKDDEFHDWAESQPKWVQDALYENTEDAKSVARVIDLYKGDKGIKTTRNNNEDRGAASSVSTKRTTSPHQEGSADYLRESQVAKMSIKEYEKRMNEITEAQRNGKFIYDMSKK
tara:strand:- start:221 stop:1189 length:969 start_codon:yes stop_codon:yes gene_type:complete